MIFSLPLWESSLWDSPNAGAYEFSFCTAGVGYLSVALSELLKSAVTVKFQERLWTHEILQENVLNIKTEENNRQWLKDLLWPQ